VRSSSAASAQAEHRSAILPVVLLKVCYDKALFLRAAIGDQKLQEDAATTNVDPD
jgi:hypothetical protein